MAMDYRLPIFTVAQLRALLAQFPDHAELMLDCGPDSPQWRPLGGIEGIPTTWPADLAEFVVIRAHGQPTVHGKWMHDPSKHQGACPKRTNTGGGKTGPRKKPKKT